MSDKKEPITLSYMEHLLSRKDAYDIKLIFPEDFNSSLGKDFAGELIEDAYKIEIDENTTDVEIDALFNMEISKRVFDFLEEKQNMLLERYNTGRAAEKDKDKYAILNKKERDELSLMNDETKKTLDVVEDFLENAEECLTSDSIKKSFLGGDIPYKDNRSREERAKSLINEKEKVAQTKPELVKASAVLKLIDETLAKIDSLMSKIDALLGMKNEEAQEETKRIDEGMDEKVKEEIEKKAVVVDNGETSEENMEVDLDKVAENKEVKKEEVVKEEIYEEAVTPVGEDLDKKDMDLDDLVIFDPEELKEKMQEKTFTSTTNDIAFGSDISASKEKKKSNDENKENQVQVERVSSIPNF